MKKKSEQQFEPTGNYREDYDQLKKNYLIMRKQIEDFLKNTPEIFYNNYPESFTEINKLTLRLNIAKLEKQIISFLKDFEIVEDNISKYLQVNIKKDDLNNSIVSVNAFFFHALFTLSRISSDKSKTIKLLALKLQELYKEHYILVHACEDTERLVFLWLRHYFDILIRDNKKHQSYDIVEDFRHIQQLYKEFSNRIKFLKKSEVLANEIDVLVRSNFENLHSDESSCSHYAELKTLYENALQLDVPDEPLKNEIKYYLHGGIYYNQFKQLIYEETSKEMRKSSDLKLGPETAKLIIQKILSNPTQYIELFKEILKLYNQYHIDNCVNFLNKICASNRPYIEDPLMAGCVTEKNILSQLFPQVEELLNFTSTILLGQFDELYITTFLSSSRTQGSINPVASDECIPALARMTAKNIEKLSIYRDSLTMSLKCLQHSSNIFYLETLYPRHFTNESVKEKVANLAEHIAINKKLLSEISRLLGEEKNKPKKQNKKKKKGQKKSAEQHNQTASSNNNEQKNEENKDTSKNDQALDVNSLSSKIDDLHDDNKNYIPRISPADFQLSDSHINDNIQDCQIKLGAYEDSAINMLRAHGYFVFVLGGQVKNNLTNSPGNINDDTDLIVFNLTATAVELSATSKLFQDEYHRIKIIYGKGYSIIRVINQNNRIIDINDISLNIKWDTINRRESIVNIIYQILTNHAKQCDFTINSIFYDPFNNKIIDPLLGCADLKNKILKSIKTPTIPPDLILRAVRFILKYQMTIPACLATTLNDKTSFLQGIDKEKSYQELNKLFFNGFAQQNFQILETFGLIELFFPLTNQCMNTTPFYRQMIFLLLADTDRLFQQKTSLSATFFYSVLLWGPLAEKLENGYTYENFKSICNEIINTQLAFLAIPLDIVDRMKSILALAFIGLENLNKENNNIDYKIVDIRMSQHIHTLYDLTAYYCRNTPSTQQLGI